MDIMDNGNCVLMSNKTNEIIQLGVVSIPTSSTVMTEIMSEDESVQVASSVNNLVSSTVSIPTNCMVMTEIMNEDDGMQVAISVNNLVSSTHIIPGRSMHTSKRLRFEDEVNYDTGTKCADQILLPDGVILIDDMLDITQSEILSSDDEFSMLCVEERGPSNWPFSPITNASQQELGPLVQITQFYTYLKYVLSGQCVQGKDPEIINPIYGDGNCYFRAISYILCGVEKFHLEVRKAVCDFIKVFDGDLKPFLRRR